MGMFQVKVRVANPDAPEQAFEELFWVDTGALYSYVPGKRLEEIGLRSLRSRKLILADGRHEIRQLGEARFTIDELNETLTCPVIFGPDDSLYLLGTTTLENFGVDADPTVKKLKPIAAIIGGFLGSRE
jgi:predicted aspartyl protease